MQSGRVRSFIPTRSGLHFVNSWPPGTSYPVVTLPVLGTVISGDASTGLCGGFVSTALDCFLHSPRLLPPATTSAPGAGTPLFNYLVNRLIDTFLAPCPDVGFIDDAGKCIAWIMIPGHDVRVSFYGPGLARRMVETEWPKIQADIDSGTPSPLYLVAAPQCGGPNIPCITAALKNCHQVLAYAYTLDDVSNLTLWVYDCNDPFNNSSTIELNISDPSQTINITATAIVAALGGEVVIRGIFHQDYSFNDPTAIMGLLVPDRSFALTELPMLLLANNPSLVPETHLLL
jgi:hypothetical protein